MGSLGGRAALSFVMFIVPPPLERCREAAQQLWSIVTDRINKRVMQSVVSVRLFSTFVPTIFA